MKPLAAVPVFAALALTACAGRNVDSEPVTRLPLAIEDTGHARPPYRFEPSDEAFLDEIQRGCFNYFWNAGNGPAKLVPDRTSIQWVSVAGIGFQLAALPIGVERGWVSREDAAARAKAILDLMSRDARIRHAGVFQHFIDPQTGGPHDSDQLETIASTIDAALFFAGALTASSYFGGEVGAKADALFAEADWASYVVGTEARHDYEQGYISLGWKPADPKNFTGPGKRLPYGWVDNGCEHRLVAFLAACAPTESHRVPTSGYYGLRRGIGADPRVGNMVFFPYSGALFTAQFSHCFIDYAGMGADDPAAHGVANRIRVDWWENSRRHSLLHKLKCAENPKKLSNLGGRAWGLSASDVPGGYGVYGVFPEPLAPSWLRPEWDYPTFKATDNYGDGTIAPYAAGTSVLFDPAGAIDALKYYRELAAKAPALWTDPSKGGWGFADSFRVNEDGTVWVGPDHLPIDHGPMMLAIENARTGLIWRVFHGHPAVKAGMARLGLEADPR
ncbi:MAG: glucoamylase family protein [Phycisphaerales bacterium]